MYVKKERENVDVISNCISECCATFFSLSSYIRCKLQVCRKMFHNKLPLPTFNMQHVSLSFAFYALFVTQQNISSLKTSKNINTKTSNNHCLKKHVINKHDNK